MKHKDIKKITYSALFMALGIALPFVTWQIPDIGNGLLPMHLPVMLCGLICSPVHGLAVGVITPLLRFLMFGAPPVLGAIPMAFELASYGCVIGFVYRLLGRKFWSVYPALISAMIVGRGVWGIAKAIVLGFASKPMTWSYFVTEGIVLAIPGIILQLVLIPTIMLLLKKAKIRV